MRPACITAIRRDTAKRLFLIVRDINGRNAEALLQLADFAAHFDPQLGVEIGQRLVEQQHRGLDNERAGDGDALELAARELMRPARIVAVEMNEPVRRRHAPRSRRPAPCARSGRRRRCRRR